MDGVVLKLAKWMDQRKGAGDRGAEDKERHQMSVWRLGMLRASIESMKMVAGAAVFCAC